ncbi:unnamed protein product [Sphagnum troendelagicum]
MARLWRTHCTLPSRSAFSFVPTSLCPSSNPTTPSLLQTNHCSLLRSCSSSSLFYCSHCPVLPTISSAAIFSTLSTSRGRVLLWHPASALQQRRSVFMGVSQAMVKGEEGGVRGGGGGATTKIKEREILVQHLLVPEDQLQLLLDLQRKIMQEGVDLSDLAAEHSICPSKSEGGMLGWLSHGRTVPEFEEAAFNAALNKLVRVKTKHGWHLLQVLSEREATFLQEIDVEDFDQQMQDPEFMQGAQLLDVREPDEITTASIQGFKAYPLSQFGQWAPTISEDLDPEKDTFVLCHHGMRSMQAAQWLQSQGFRRLYNIKGGIHAYSVKVNNSIPKY